MYEILKKGSFPLIESNSFYKSDTTEIYKVEDTLYKLYLKKDPFKRQVLDFLIAHYDELKEISIPPISKLKIDDNYGLKMLYVESEDFLSYIKNGKIPPEEMVRIIKILSDNLKIHNKLGIHFSDLHHHNILIRETDKYPLYIDLDDATVGNYPSTRICKMAHRLHNVKNKTYEYEGDLIKYGNLDQECLVLMLLNYIYDKSLERLPYDEFQRKIERLSPYFENDFLTVAASIKQPDDTKIVIPYPHYIGDFITNESFPSAIQKVKRRINNENSDF